MGKRVSSLGKFNNYKFICIKHQSSKYIEQTSTKLKGERNGLQ